MASHAQFRHEDIAAVPRGWKVRTVTQPSGHRVRLAFPPGRRHKGAGRLISILHPTGASNPSVPSEEEFSLMLDKMSRPELLKLTRAWGFTAHKMNDAELRKSLLSLKQRVESQRKHASNPLDAAALSRILEAAKRRGIAMVKGVTAKNASASMESEPEVQQAIEQYKTFHGKEPKEIIELQESEAQRGTYSAIGPLEELVLRTPGGPKAKLDFSRDGVKLASNPEGTQLYLIDGNQNLNGSLAEFGSDTSKDFVDLGEALSVTYQARKSQNNFNLASWRHKFGEEGGDRPFAFFDKLRKRIFLVGGSYKIQRPGIIN